MYFLFQIFSIVLACNDRTVCIFSMAEMSIGRNVRGRNVLAETSVAEMSEAEMSEHRYKLSDCFCGDKMMNAIPVCTAILFITSICLSHEIR